MSDKELIKQEIERIEQILDDFNKTHNNTIDNSIITAKKNICKHIKFFINSLPEESVSEDLEEAASKYVREDFHERSRADFKAGAKWQKQQMMKDAVEAEVFSEIKGSSESTESEFRVRSGRFKTDGIKLGDKVKIIIIKYEQQ